ncbi:lipoprotein-releasing ABC transporter permease subunit [Parerythrobacter lacustris]|uniref:Lipoprotein-releasing ABC transporter permease subunit n=1 Tax=Parerythrobacter lacustris TaxID=2969984 RepID=A0ABT1XT87_9SPHN|nr:lipoprotein-releasing ABC transporter permease subunit [Parerythrobacter lacustris]MCR2833657.1 lipoprotein-releasing ABC transporter permease subunit [Parerythrobacter lacustris]
MLLSNFERTIAKRYLLPGRSEAFIALVAGISVVVVMLSVAMLVTVMSVMNGFRGELLDRIVGLNGHAIVQAYGGRLDNWQGVLKEIRATEGVTEASPLIEQPLLTSFNGRVEGIVMRGNTAEDIAALQEDLIAGRASDLKPGASKVIIGARLAENIGASIGSTITIINPQGRTTPFGTVPRQIGYEVAGLLETGIYEFDQAFVIMPIPDAQTLLLSGDKIGMIEVQTEDPDRVDEIMAPVKARLQSRAVVSSWKEINSSIFEALEVERVAMFFALSIIVVVAAFNILSSLVMLVRAKTRDIAIMRTMGATRRSVLKIFVTTGFIVGAIGTGAGLALGFLLLAFRQPIVEGIQWLTGAQLWNPEVRILTELPARVDVVEVASIALLTLGLCLLATLYPALKAAKTDPVQVLRYE